MCEGFRSFIGMLFLLFVVFPIVAFIWIPMFTIWGKGLMKKLKCTLIISLRFIVQRMMP